MRHDLIRRLEGLGNPRVVVIGDLVLDRYIWGFAERISQEAPVPLLRADQREHRLGGAASVATMLRALGAEVVLVGGVGCDAEATWFGGMLTEQGIDDRLVLPLDDRPTTLKERYIGRRPGPAPPADDPRRLRKVRPDPGPGRNTPARRARRRARTG